MTASARPVVSVTPNPALDITYEVDDLRVGQSHRVSRVRERAGGKGINVARVVRALGEPAVVVAPFGGRTGDALLHSLRADGFEVAAVPVDAETRRTVTVVSGGEATALNEAGPALSAPDWDDVVGVTGRALEAPGALVVSGSTPPGTPPDLHARLIEHARRAGVPVVVDTSGPALLRAAVAGPDLVKPNVDELRAATGETDVVVAAHSLLERGARQVVVSLGGDGLAGFAAGAQPWRVRAVPGLTGNPTGAGDAVVAALALGLVAGTPWPEVLVRATALGAAAVLADVAGDVDLAAYERFRPTLTAERYR